MSSYAGGRPPHTQLQQESGRIDPASWAYHRFGLPVERWASLSGLRIWIIGGGTGYGRALAHALSAAQSRVWVSGRRQALLDGTIASGEAAGIDMRGCQTLVADITDGCSLAAAAQCIGDAAGQIDALVCCAALPQPRTEGGDLPLLNLPQASWQALIDTNVTGQLLAFRAAWPLWSASPHPRAVLFSSEAGWSFTPGFGPYNLSKAALNNLGASLAAEAAAALPGNDVQVNILDPGEASSEMNRGSPNSPYTVAAMVLALISHPRGGPNGHFFHRDGRHLAFCKAYPFASDLLSGATKTTT